MKNSSMGDPTLDKSLLCEEQYRVATYGNQNFPVDKVALAKSGFYYTHKGSVVKCFKCDLEIDAAKSTSADIDRCHKEHIPKCNFATESSVQQPSRSKKFASYDSLRFEKERLETFIDWPVSWLSPADLACDGFYYLRTADHCACVFCRGIVGAWEKGDTPRGEHQRHFPHCPFVTGQAVGNIPLEQSQIISRISPSRSPTAFPGVDVCGNGSRHMPGSYSEKSGPPSKNSKNYESMGLPQHTGPKRRDYLTYESRLASFVRWPDLVKQKPTELAEAGFFYCGLSDHVRCFHCGNGLRNWETDDEPWKEHARWYPDCNFVLLKKGQEFIDQVRRERPPYLRSQPAVKPSVGSGASSSAKPTIGDSELDPLMELDIIKAVLVMGFPREKVRAALRRKLEQTGMPFFSLEPCIEAVLQYMEEETRQTLNERSSQEIENEATGEQAAKMAALQPGNRPTARTSETTSSHSGGERSLSPQPSTSSAGSDSQVSASSAGSGSPVSVGVCPETTPVSPIASAHSTPSEPPSITSLSPSLSSGSSSSVSSLSSLRSPQSITAMPVGISTTSIAPHHEPMDVDEPVSRVRGRVNETIDVVNRANEAITQANQVMGMAERALKPPPSDPPSLETIEKKIEGPDENENEETNSSTSKFKKAPCAMSSESSRDLADELEKLRESRMCKVCMDAEMDVVFLPCAHMVTCASCALAMAQCPICRDDIKFTIKPILS